MLYMTDLDGTYTITSGTLEVKLSNNTNGKVIADAVRIASVSSHTSAGHVVRRTQRQRPARVPKYIPT